GVFCLVGMQNTVNFLDGADGLAAGVVAIVAIVLMLAAGQQKQVEIVELSGALAGCCVGFLVFNFPPARIFMGDSGAHFLGIALGMISVLGVAKVAVAFAPAAGRIGYPIEFEGAMKPTPSEGPTVADMAGIGIYFAACVLVPLLGGVALDKVFHTAPVFVLLGLLVGLAAGATSIWLKVRE